MTSKYTPPRSAQDSEEKKRREEGQNYDRRPTPPPVIDRKPTVKMKTYTKEEDGRTYEYHTTDPDPLSPKAFHSLTRGRYKPRRST